MSSDTAIQVLKENGYDINSLVDRFRLTTKLLGWGAKTVEFKGTPGTYTYKAQLLTGNGWHPYDGPSFLIKAIDTHGKEYNVIHSETPHCEIR